MSGLASPQIGFNYLGRFGGSEPAAAWGFAPEAGAVLGLSGSDSELPPAHALEVNAVALEEPNGPQLSATWSWPGALLSEEAVSDLAHDWFRALEALVRHAAEPSAGGHTPSDFPLVALSQAAVERLEAQYPKLEDILPLSPLQEGLLFHALYDTQAPDVYGVHLVLDLEGPLDAQALHAAAEALLERHANLRASFVHDGLSWPVQVIVPELALPWCEVDLSGLGPAQCEERLAQLLAQERTLRFELGRGPLLRFSLIRLGLNRHRLLLSNHHLLMDGWSLPVVVRELFELYKHTGRSAALGRVTPYRDYLRWIAGQDRQSARVAWQRALEGLEEPTRLAAAQPGAAPALPEEIMVELPEALTEAISRQARSHSLSLNTILQGAWAILLGRLTGRDDVVFGTTVAGRPAEIPGIETMVGLFINTLPVRVRLRPAEPLSELLTRLQDSQSELIAHQHLGLAEIQSLAGLGELFDTLVVFENYPVDRSALAQPVARLDLTGVEAHDATHYPLSLVAVPAERLRLRLQYRIDLFERSSVEAMGRRLVTLLEAVVADPTQPIGRIDLLAPEERRQLLFEWNATAREVPEVTLPALFEAQVRRSPDATALVFEECTLTYAQLNTQANRLAHFLIGEGIGPEDLVALALPRSVEMVISLLAILKAGAAYLPIDPDYPAERLRYMVEDSGAKVLLTQRALSEPLFSGLNVVSVHLDDAKDQIGQQNNEPLPPLAGASNRACVLYTSGSTGRPKGVEIEHRSLTNFLCSMAREPGLTKNDVLLAVTTLGFDIAGLELFLPLITGARIELASRETAMEGAALAHKLTTSSATVMQATPATWRMLFDSEWKGDRRLKVLCGGEALDRDLAARLIATCGSVWNMYGPTETTIWSSIAKLTSDEVTIGRPIANTQMYVLDRNREPVLRGVVGELWIGGEGVARGYLNRVDLTTERFVPNPFHQGGRMYRTGDRARYLPDGRLVCLGRTDNQVKIRGHRIELEEIATVVSSHPNVRECVVVLQNSEAEDPRLVAYIVSATAQRPAVADLRSYLRTSLPNYMVPSSFAFLDAISLTPNGKVDRSTLPTVEVSLLDANPGYVPPRDRIEQIVADAWSEVLGVEKVGIFDHFFELGGHSLSATRLIARLKSAFQIDLPLSSIFIEPTVAGLSKQILYDDLTGRYHRVGEIRRWNRLIPAQPRGSRPPLFLVVGYGDRDATLRLLSRLIPYLGLDQPVYGLQARWLDGASEPYSSAKEAALEFLSDLRAVQPKGPYMLGGDCVGGIIALAMAEELVRLGEEVRLLVLLDTYRPSFFLSIAFALNYWWSRVRHVTSVLGRLICKRGRERAELIRDLVRRKLGGDRAETQEELASGRFSHSMMHYARTMYRYRPKKYPGRITLIVNEQQYRSNKSMGWSGVASGSLEVYSTPGEHGTRYLHGKELAERLRECIDRCWQPEPCAK